MLSKEEGRRNINRLEVEKGIKGEKENLNLYRVVWMDMTFCLSKDQERNTIQVQCLVQIARIDEIQESMERYMNCLVVFLKYNQCELCIVADE